uniref:Secreted protein n=1 Tax=Globodera pallida TaxID=36090 RepID=A0A183C9E2_GLOPA
MGFTADHLAHALLLGPLCATIVEHFVANRTEEFRAQTRAVLLEIESWKFDETKWHWALPRVLHQHHRTVERAQKW